MSIDRVNSELRYEWDMYELNAEKRVIYLGSMGYILVCLRLDA
jgi:hypothetical protein